VRTTVDYWNNISGTLVCTSFAKDLLRLVLDFGKALPAPRGQDINNGVEILETFGLKKKKLLNLQK
jgi:hypothetical protein